MDVLNRSLARGSRGQGSTPSSVKGSFPSQNRTHPSSKQTGDSRPGDETA